MEYNSARPDLIIPEYGRNVHNMVEYAMSVADIEERTKIANAIVNVMAQLTPHLRELEDYQHKLWDHLYIISDFKLEVNAPYPMPAPEKLAERPAPLPYPQTELKYGHYGKNIQNIIDVCKDYTEGDEKEQLKLIIANLMKRHYMAWNSGTVVDHVIKKQLKEMSDGKLVLADEVELVYVAAKTHKPNNNHKKKKSNKKYYKKR